MKYLFFGGALFAVLGIALFLVGLALPKGHTASVSRELRAPADRVFGAITDFGKLPSWRSGLKSVDIEASGMRYIEHGEYGDIPMRIVERRPPARLVTEIDDPSLPFGGTWTFEIEPNTATGGSRITITERGVVSNPIYRFMSKFVFGHDKTLRTYAGDLEKYMSL